MKSPKIREINNLKSWLDRKIGAAALERMLILNQYKLLYVETPKAGCTKIRSLLILLNRGYEDGKLADFLKTTSATYYHWEFGIPDNQTYHNKELLTLFNNPDYCKFAFVRNPYERLASAYADRIYAPHLKNYEYYIDFAQKIKAESIWHPVGLIPRLVTKIERCINAIIPPPKASASLARFGSEKDYLPQTTYDYASVEQKIKESYGKYTKHPYKQVYEKLKMLFGYPNIDSIDLNKTPVSFEEFINFVCDQNIEDMDEHWQVQTYYIGYDFIDYDFIGRLESFAQDIQVVFNKINAPDYIYRYITGKLNESKRKETQINWTDELAEKVYEKYRSDFEAFGYDRMSYKIVSDH